MPQTECYLTGIALQAAEQVPIEWDPPFFGGTRMRIRKGITLLQEEVGSGPAVERKQFYVIAIRISLSRGEIVRASEKCLGHEIDEHLKIHDDGYFEHRVRIDRENLVAGVF